MGISIIDFSHYDHLYIFYFLLCHYTSVLSYGKGTGRKILKNTGYALSRNPQVIQTLKDNHYNQSLQKQMLFLSKKSNLDYIVLINLKGIRFTHPDSTKIGKPFQGGDEQAVFKGKAIMSTAEGSLGKSLRYLIPVYDHQKQVGAIAVGLKLTTLGDLSQSSIKEFSKPLLISILISLVVTSIISYGLKKQLHNLHPSDIFQHLEERNATLDQIQAAVFVIDQRHIIKRNNPAASLLFKKEGQRDLFSGKLLESLIPQLKQDHFSKKTEQVLHFQGQDYLLSISPITVKTQNRGYVVFLRNVTETLFTLDQLAHTTAYASALQAQTHQFMNQLHVIYGLADIEYYDELKIYLKELLEPQNEFLARLSMLVREPRLASFIIGEREKFAEKHINLSTEILVEIPTKSTVEDVNNYLLLHRYINTKILTLLNSTTLVSLRLNYQNNLIETDYQWENEKWLLNDYHQYFNDAYFQQLLVDSRATYKISLKQNKVIIRTNIIYSEGS
ncbi:sensor histidine kinase [Streptococcus agalactiae]|nr:sensor histidine kinase [Streptococcus agalactiae]